MTQSDESPVPGERPLEPKPDQLIGSVLAGRYRILSLLGEGAMGAVYLGEHVTLGRRDAIKVLHSGMSRDPEAIARFNRGARNVSAIRHPNVCTIYDFSDTDQGLQYMAMELVTGVSLQDVLDREGTLSLSRTTNIAEQVAAALQAAHNAEIVHRDLKPANIMVSKGPDGEDQVKVVDFDISKGSKAGVDSDVTQLGYLVGTPDYMSPEQVTGDALDGRSDVYALALVVIRMLTGGLPFKGTSMLEKMTARLTDTGMLKLSDIMPSRMYPTAVQEVLDRALIASPELRTQTAARFASELRNTVESISSVTQQVVKPLAQPVVQPVIQSAAQPEAPPVVPARASRPRLPWAAIAVGALGVASVAGVWVWRGQDASPRQRDAAATQQGSNVTPPGAAPNTTPGAASGTPLIPKNSATRTAAPDKGTATALVVPRSGGPAAGRMLLRLRIAGLSPAFRDSARAIAGKVNGIQFVETATDDADLSLEADGSSTISIVGADKVTRARVPAASLATPLLQILRHDVAGAIFASMETPAARSALKFDLANGKQTYHFKEVIRFSIRSSVAGYLTLVDIGPDGVGTVLMPSQAFGTPQLAAGREMIIPESRDSIIAGTPAGIGNVRAIVTDTPLGLTGDGGEFITTFDGALLAEKVRSAVMKKTKAAGKAWATASTSYTVRP